MIAFSLLPIGQAEKDTPLILREFLYVDTDKVRGMLAQLEEGIAEEAQSTRRDERRTEGGVKGIASHYQGVAEESRVNKSFGDALFPRLEDFLDSQGIIHDISDELQDSDFWTSSRLRSDIPPGSVIRLTAPGSLFDARYVATNLAGFAATYSGLEGIGAFPQTRPSSRRATKAAKPSAKSTVSVARDEIEEAIPNFGPMPVDGNGPSIDGDFLRAIVKVSRGLFLPGLHLNLWPAEGDTHTVGARLQEGRQFLDSEPEILFARYGTGRQLWTVVGTIGHYSDQSDQVTPAATLVDEGQNVVRGRTASFINSFMRSLGSLGFADVPQYPGFAVVPIAVYRLIPSPAAADLPDRALV